MENLIRCPVCGKNIFKSANLYICENKHTYDISKEGYVNFVMCNTKNSKQPGDSKEMMIARKDFLNSNNYKPLLDKIIEIIRANVKEGIIVEAGCGEGYFLLLLVIKQTLSKMRWIVCWLFLLHFARMSFMK